MHSLTGTMAISESQLKDAELMAIEEINDKGGVLGAKIEAVVVDPQSRFTDGFPEKARKLLLNDQVAAVFGCWTSVSRVNVLPQFEQFNGLLFYPVPYEGNEASWNCIYSGATPNQQILPAIEWLLTPDAPKRLGIKKERFTNIYLLGTNYIYPRTVNYIIDKYLKTRGLEPVNQVHTPFGHRDYANIVQNIKIKNPDVVFSTINGDSNIWFYKELKAQGVTADMIPVVAVNIGEDELRDLNPADVKGHLAASNYFQSIDTPNNKAFVKRLKAKYGGERIANAEIAAAYAQVYLWKLAAEKAKSTASDAVRQSIHLGPLEFDAPEGKIKLEPTNHHAWKAFYMGKIRDDRQIDIIYKTDLIKPDPFPPIAFPGWSVDLTKGKANGISKGKSQQIWE
jgi:urea transport system substrate-binding protein